MDRVYVLLYNCDPQNTLGGSCDRDIKNVSNLIKSMTDLKYVIYTGLNQNQSSFRDICHDFVSGMTENDMVIVYFSGHGYQTRDTNGDEKDGQDEYIMTKFGRVLDDDINNYLIKKLPKGSKFIGISDTCHSGTMFDLEGQVNLSSKYSCLSIGACDDRELENCDIGLKIGFGGALTIQLLESMIDGKCLLEYLIINFDKNECVLKVQQSLLEKLKAFGQHPIINCQ
jgi:hypothetical protein